MQAPYDTEATADVFAKARNTFNWLIGHLSDAQTGTLAHDRLEETITEQGRELQRLLLQAHLTCARCARCASWSRYTTPATPTVAPRA